MGNRTVITDHRAGGSAGHRATRLSLAAGDTDAALDYLKTQQNADGGFGSGFSPDSAVGSTADAVLAIVAAGGDPAAFDQGGNTPLTYLAANASSASHRRRPGQADPGRHRCRRESPHLRRSRLGGQAGGHGRRRRQDRWRSGHLCRPHAWPSWPWPAPQRPIPAAAVDYIKAAQQENGAWAWDGTAETRWRHQHHRLCRAGPRRRRRRRRRRGGDAVPWPTIKSIQNEDGGWPYQNPSDYGTDTDANSTAVTIQAIIAAGQDPAGADWTTAEGSAPAGRPGSPPERERRLCLAGGRARRQPAGHRAGAASGGRQGIPLRHDGRG